MGRECIMGIARQQITCSQSVLLAVEKGTSEAMQLIAWSKNILKDTKNMWAKEVHRRSFAISQRWPEHHSWTKVRAWCKRAPALLHTWQKGGDCLVSSGSPVFYVHSLSSSKLQHGTRHSRRTTPSCQEICQKAMSLCFHIGGEEEGNMMENCNERSQAIKCTCTNIKYPRTMQLHRKQKKGTFTHAVNNHVRCDLSLLWMVLSCKAESQRISVPFPSPEANFTSTRSSDLFCMLRLANRWKLYHGLQYSEMRGLFNNSWAEGKQASVQHTRRNCAASHSLN